MKRCTSPLFFALPVILLLGLAARSAVADEVNRNFMPFGERAAFVGNAGLTSPLGEAVYYNPANLARIEYPNLSVSGNLYMRFEIKADPFIQFGDEAPPFEASGFISNPSTLISTYEIGSFSLATAVLIPEALQYKNRTSLDTSLIEVTVLQDFKEESLWIGGGLARKFGSDFSIGISAFAAKESTAQLVYIRAEPVNAEAVAETTQSADSTVWNLNAIAGLHWQASPTVGIGLRVQPPPLKLTGSADLYTASVTAGTPMNDEIIETEFEDVDVSKPFPWDMGIGLSWRATPRLELLLDANLQLPATLTQMDDPQVGVEELETDIAPRFNLGLDWQFVDTWWLRLGATYNHSAAPGPETDDDQVQDHYYGVTGGIAWQSGRTQTAIGGFVFGSDTTFIVIDSDPPRESDTAYALFYGALLTVSYRL